MIPFSFLFFNVHYADASGNSIIHDFGDEYFDKSKFAYPVMIDKDYESREYNKYPTFVFKKPVYIGMMYLKFQQASSYNQRLIVRFSNGQEKSLEIPTKAANPIFDSYMKINMDNVVSVSIERGNNYNYYFYEIDFFIGTPLEKLTNVTSQSDHESVLFRWTNSVSNDFNGVLIKKDGVVIADLGKDVNSYKIGGLTEDTQYQFELYAKYIDEDISEPVLISVKTTSKPKPEPVGEVKTVTIKSFHNRVNLSWSLPVHQDFHHVNIYRDEIIETSYMDKLFGTSIAYAAETPIFETNGTYFNDLTVKPEKTYEYTLKTASTEGIESEGVTVQTTTPAEPTPELKDGGYKKDENGDYIFTWTSPTTGKVKVLIDGIEYKTVEASLKQILIPKNDMKYDLFNNPKVTLVPISESGKEGTPTKPNESGGSGGLGSAKIPFGPTDLLKSTMSLFGVIAPILLLSLATIYFRPIKNVIVKSVQNHRERRMYR